MQFVHKIIGDGRKERGGKGTDAKKELDEKTMV